ncbi:hypothetical protein KSP35_07695 [Aquihabitans sp. G128]|uniref:hypothetical protein n=1 Tax=Aquihabitans sp. G128 TaxID=2849779 RepID=UPI001C246683|nr:hypothetical protein [Aquihabitans sp. G128]QXC62668.1 hypothetical protein KSP35_07695 [Aquihabitans sp. G128]
MSLLAASSALRTFHLDWAWVVIVGNGLAGLWALAAHRYPQARHRALWWFTGAAEVAVFVQVIVGVILIQDHPDKEPFQFHMLYGFSAAFAVAIVYSYRNQLKPHLYLLYGGGGLFLMGLGLRALEVGPH